MTQSTPSPPPTDHLPPSLLVTKLYIPWVRQNLVSRPHLLARLDEGAQRKLTLVSAPAGFGKTTLLSEWATTRRQQDGPALAWLSLDEADNDPARFWAYVRAALATVAGDSDRQATIPNQDGPSTSSEAFLTGLINEIATLPHEVALILDDYHLLDTPAIHQGLAFLLDYLPPQLHLIIAGRIDPPLPLARLRARGQLTELHAAELRFSPDEAAAFLNRVMDLNLTAGQIAALEARTEGWIAGLQLAALSMRDRRDVSGFIAGFTGSQHYILDYLVEEVLHRQSEGVQTFLLCTAILDRLNGPLCDALLTDLIQPPPENSQALLHRLEHANLFLIPLDERQQWYRYHHLFRDFLRARLARQWPDRVPELHRRARTWYEQHHFHEEAIAHALAAADFEPAADLIEGAARDLLRQARFDTLLDWLEALPQALIANRPQLGLVQTWSLLLTLQFSAAAGHLAAVEDAGGLAMEEPGETLAALSGEVEAIKTLLSAFRGDVETLREQARRARRHLPAESDSFVQGMLAVNLAVPAMLGGEAAAAAEAFAEAARIGRADGNLLVTIFAMCHQAEMLIVQGQLHQAAGLYREALQLEALDVASPPPFAGLVHLGLAEVLREWNDLAAATDHLTEGLVLVEQWGDLIGFEGYITLARVRQAGGDTAGARAAIDTATRLARRLDFTELDDLFVAAHLARLSIAQGNLAAAEAWAQSYRGRSLTEQTYYLHEVEQLTLARLLIALGQADATASALDEAVALLDDMLPTAERLGRTGSIIEILILLALAQHLQGDTTPARTRLERALDLAAPEGFVRLFVDLGPSLLPLLRQASATGRQAGYARRLLAACAPAERPPTTPPELTSPDLIEPLTEREQEVLVLLAAGLANQEIADELVVAVSTVRTHLKNIYGKLGVANRVQAVRQAQDLGLLP